MARRLLVLKVATGAPFADLTPAEAAELRAAAEPVSADELIYVLRAFLRRRREMRRSPHPRVELEIAAVRATRRPHPQAIETLITKLEEAEARLRQMPTSTAGSAPARPVVVQTTLLDARPAPGASPPPRAATSAAARGLPLATGLYRPAAPGRPRTSPWSRPPLPTSRRPAAIPGLREQPRHGVGARGHRRDEAQGPARLGAAARDAAPRGGRRAHARAPGERLPTARC